MTKKLYSIKFDNQAHNFAGLYEEDLLCRRWDIQKQFYELDLLKHVRASYRRGLYFDAGANLGNHSVFFMHHCPCTHLVAVEAHPDIYRVLCDNLHRNFSKANKGSMEAHNFCLDYTPNRWATMSEINRRNVGGTMLGLIHTEQKPDAVPTKTVDEVLATNQHDVAMIKVDCEGMDYRILTGALSTIKQHRPMIAFEADTTSQYDDIAGLLRPLDYVRTFKTNKKPASYVWQWRPVDA